MLNNPNSLNKICHIVSGDLWGGAEAQAYSLIAEIHKAKDYDICVIVFNAGELKNKLVNQGIQTELLNENELNIFLLIIRIYQFIKKNKIKLIHVHGIKENLVAGIAGKLANMVLIRTHHGKGMLGVNKKYILSERLNAKFLTHKLISVSDDLKAFLVAQGLPDDKIVTIKNGIKCFRRDTKKINNDLRSSLHIGANDFVFGTVGRVSIVKNQKFLINALPNIVAKHPNFKVIIVGDGPLMSELKKQVVNLSLTNNVIFTGYQDNVAIYFEIMDVFVMTSIHEGIPIAMLEAMCEGIPVISSKVGGIPEIISNSDNGMLFELNNTNHFVELCLKLISDECMKDKLSKRASEYVNKVLTLENTVKKTTNIYQEYL